jgi:hypothetical protein
MEYSPHEIEAINLQRDIDRMIEADARPYSHKEWLSAPSKKTPVIKRDPRGSKRGVKRGPYQSHLKPNL